MVENIIEALKRGDYQVLTSLAIIKENDPRLHAEFYDKWSEIYRTPISDPYAPRSLDEQKQSLRETAQEILDFWNKPEASYIRLEKECELEHDELRIQRRMRDDRGGVLGKTLYIVRLGEDAFFSWTFRW